MPLSEFLDWVAWIKLKDEAERRAAGGDHSRSNPAMERAASFSPRRAKQPRKRK